MESMESTGVKQAREKAVSPNVVATSFSAAGLMSSYVAPALEPGASHSIGYGMPCAKCRAYYPADMDACPICKSKERISMTGNGRPAHVASVPAASSHSDAAKLLAEERERLRELKSQIYASQPQMPATTFRCALDQNHDRTTVEPAAVCHSCYGGMRQQVGHMETALHMEPKEAAKIVYEAVWADTSDPDKTYYNAAVALLAELRKRAGIAK
jgi:hypothetical protein